MMFVTGLIVALWVVLYKEISEEHHLSWHEPRETPIARMLGTHVYLVPLPVMVTTCSTCNQPTVQGLHDAMERGDTLPPLPRAVCTC